MSEKITSKKFKKMKKQDEKIAILTSYDYPTAKILEDCGTEAILVGDSLGNTILGYKNTLPVTMEEMIHHTKAVTRATGSVLVIADMPFNSYQIDVESAVQNASRFVKEGKAEAVKVEGGREVTEQVKAILDAGVPVMGHLGLTPQKILQFGSYRPRGMGVREAKEIIEDALKLEKSGVFSVVLESIPKELAKIITEKLDIPTIGIGAGPHCDGQVLVLHDMLGLSEFKAKFVKRYTDLKSSIKESVKNFLKDVRKGKFPADEHTYEMGEGELDKLRDCLKLR